MSVVHSPSPATRPARALGIGGRRGGFWIVTAALLSALCSLLAQVAFERALGVAGFAQWAYLTALVGLFVPLACMGANHLLLSEFYEGHLVDRADASRVILYVCSFSAIALAAFIVVYQRGARASEANLPLSMVTALFVAQVLVTLAFPVYQARAQTGWVALWPLLQVGLRAGVGALAMLAAWSLLEAVGAWTVVCICLAAVAAWQVWPSVRARLERPAAILPEVAGSRPGTRRTVAAGVGFGISELLDALDLKLLVPLAAFLFGAVETAASGLAVVVLSAVFFFPHALINRVLLPAIHRASSTPAEQLEIRRLILRLCAASLVVLAPITALMYAYGYPLIARAVRGDYSSQATALSWLAFCLVPLCISQLGAAPHLERRRTWRLLRWRLEALAIFVGVAMVFRSLGLASLVLGFAIGRVWLSVRVLEGLRRLKGPDRGR